MATPGPVGSSSRCVVLRPRLADCPEAFAYYVIAHEFAHAYLRNGGWGEITDIEEAADALAESWGFRRPAVQSLVESSPVAPRQVSRSTRHIICKCRLEIRVELNSAFLSRSDRATF